MAKQRKGTEVVEDNVDESLGIKKGESESTPSYRVVGDSKIPVSQARGKLWKGRRDIAQQKKKCHIEVYEEGCRYYRNDQSSHRNNRRNSSGNQQKKLTGQWSETENVLFSDVRSLAAIIYSKDPRVEITSMDRSPETEDEESDEVTCLERLINRLITMRESPGINLKPKARQAIVNVQLSNEIWAVLGWNFKEHSSEAALKDLRNLSEKLSKAKTQKEIRELEGKIQAVEAKFDILQPEGLTLKLKTIGEILADSDSVQPDHSDANWKMYSDMFPTMYLNAVYGKDKDGVVTSVYDPTHILSAGEGDTGTQDEINNFTLFKESEPSKYGFDDKDSYDSAKRTKVWIVWDKITRRVEMYADNKWDWPIWVWDDLYGLQEFFPMYKLSLVIDPDKANAKPEAAYILDQQDAINDINSQEQRTRNWAMGNIFYNKKKIDQKDVEAVLNGSDGMAKGIDVPDGMKLSDIIFSFVPPATQYKELFDKEGKYQAIDRITNRSAVLRGGQFKSNTTNDEVDFVRDVNGMIIDDKTDAIEDWIGKIGNGMLQMVIKFMSVEQVAQLIGEDDAKIFGKIKSQADSKPHVYSLQVVGGSTEKPTSRAKKAEALKMSQVIGQFAKAAPAAALVMLRVLERSFDEVTLPKEDIEEIRKSIQAQLQQGNTQPQGAGAQPGATPPQTPPSGQPTEQPQGGELQQLLGSLPPQLQQAIQLAVDRGVPMQQAIVGVIQQAQAQQPT